MTEQLSYPRANARTRRFTLGRPRSFRAVDGRVLFLRSGGGDDVVHDLWELDVASGEERRLTDARSLGVDADLPPEERARRERLREQGGGIVAYDLDAAGRRATFALGGTVHVLDLATLDVVAVAAAGPAFDPRLSPDGGHLAAVVADGLHTGPTGGALSGLVGEPDVTFGLAEFIAAEEMQRTRGHWWSPSSERLLVARVDERAVAVWTIADPANPDAPGVAHRYPAAGTANADVTLWLVELDGTRTEVIWDRAALPYVAQVAWTPDGPPLVLAQSRDQRRWQVLSVADDGSTTIEREDRDDVWLDITSPPAWVDGEVALVVDRPDLGDGGTRVLMVGDRAVTPAGMQVRDLAAVEDGWAWLAVTEQDPAQVQVVRVEVATGAIERLTDAPGVHGVVAQAGTVVLTTASLDRDGVAVTVRRGDDEATITSLAWTPQVRDVELVELGPRRLRGALLRPDGDGPWPVLLLPYGGPHAQRVVHARASYGSASWYADQGFAVLVADGRGTPGRGPAFERDVHLDFASAVLEDQIAALRAAAALEPRLDLARVAISGWSFGGYLAALAVLRRPDVFRAGVAGAPVTDWRLYDTHYTERYLGHPDEHPEAYRRSSLVDADGELIDAAPPTDPDAALLVIHGLADDNVVAAHSLRLSSALLAAGRPHEFLPLSGVTHMTPQEVVAEHLLLHERDFLRRALGR